MIVTTSRRVALTIAALWSLPVSAGDLPPSVYVAPGGVYINSARVYVAPGVGNGEQPYAVPDPAYAPGYAPPYGAPRSAFGPAYGPTPAYRAPPLAVYGARPTVGMRRYASPYPAEYAPRPPAAVPYDGGSQCVVSYGRVFCD